VRRLWCAPTLFYMPLLPHIARDAPSIDHLAFPPGRFRPTLEAMARAADRAVGPATGADRIYLARRDAHQRRLENRSEIEALVERRGFVIVHPEELDFAEQIRYVRQARYIVGPQGSSLYLSMFARPGTKQCHLSHPFTVYETTYSEILEEAGVALTVFTGPAVRANDEPGYPNFDCQQFADYRIDADAFALFLDAWSTSGSAVAIGGKPPG